MYDLSIVGGGAFNIGTSTAVRSACTRRQGIRSRRRPADLPFEVSPKGRVLQPEQATRPA